MLYYMCSDESLNALMKSERTQTNEVVISEQTQTNEVVESE